MKTFSEVFINENVVIYQSTAQLPNHYVLVWQKSEQKTTVYYYFYTSLYKILKRYDFSGCSSQPLCQLPIFMDQMIYNPLKQYLVDIIPFMSPNAIYYLLWFTIDGKPYYCMNPEMTPLTDQVLLYILYNRFNCKSIIFILILTIY